MLVITVKETEVIRLGKDIYLVGIKKAKGKNKFRVAFDAPEEISIKRVNREEL